MKLVKSLETILVLTLALILALGAACTPTAGTPAAPDTGGPAGGQPTESAGETPTVPVAEPGGTDEGADPLTRSTWALVEYGPQGALTAPLPDTMVTLGFDAGALNGSAGCNSYFADYTVEGAALEIGVVGSTMMWCEGAMDQESAYLALLGEVKSFVLAADGSELTLEGPAGLLRFAKPAPTADLPLEGPVWVLDTIISGDTAQTPLNGSTVTLEFGADKVSGNTGCNFYGAGYTLDGDALAIGMAEVTLQLCSDELMAQEAAYLTALGAAENLALEGERLRLFHSTGELVFRPAADAPIVGTTWTLTGIALPDAEAMVQTWIDAEITAEFVDGQMLGFAGCNHYFVDYVLDDLSLSFGPAGSTMMACDEERMARESEFLGALEKVTGYQVKMDTLTLTGMGGAALLSFQVATDLPLEGTAWTLQGLVRDGALESTWVDAEISAAFADGQVTGSAGCNSYFGSYALDGAVISLGPIGRTEMACLEEGRMEREDAFLEALAAAADYQIKMDTLTLTDAAGEPLLVFKAGGPAVR